MGLSNTAAMLMFLLVAGVAFTQADKQAPREMKSDAEYNEDLVKDGKPTTVQAEDFTHPYPHLQEDNSFDSDFVKDSNSDEGEWAAQMEYDRLRSMIKSAEKRLPMLKEKTDEALKIYEDAVGDEKKVHKEITMGELPAEIEAEESEFKAVEEEKVAVEEEKQAEEEEELVSEETDEVQQEKIEAEKIPEPKLLPAPQKPVVAISTAEVDAAVAKLKECEQKVLDAKDKLMKEVGEREGLKKALEESEAAEGKAKDTEASADKASDEAKSLEKAAEGNATEADAKYQKEVQDVENLKAEMDSAAYKIKQMRGAVADGSGGVVAEGYAPKSDACKTAGSLLLVLVAGFLTSI